MARKIVAILVLVTLLLAATGPVALAAKPHDIPGQGGRPEKPWKTTPEDLPVLRVPGEHWPKGRQPGQWSSGQWGWGGGSSAPEPNPDVNMFAVVIGIADYSGRTNDLWHPDEDAVDMKEALVEKYGFPEENIWLLLNRDAKLAAIEDALAWLADWENEESSIVFFYSGHGFQREDSEGFDDDVEVDGIDEGIVSYDMYGLSDGWLLAQFSTLGFQTEKFAMIFGSCHSGGMFDDPHVDLQQLGGGRVIPTACKERQVTWDYYYLNNTLFGYYYVDQALLGNPPIDGYASELPPTIPVSIEEALLYTAPLVIFESDKIPEEDYPTEDKITEPIMWDAYPGEYDNAAELIPGEVGPPPVNEPPVADPNGPYEGTEDVAITFNGSASYDPDEGDTVVSYTWDFGDGSAAVTVDTATVDHTYTTGSKGVTVDYEVTLVVSDGKANSEPATTIASVTGVNDLPEADANGPYSGFVGEAITFDASGSSDEEGIASYTWDFGDTTEAVTIETLTVEHIYTEPSPDGGYVVTLTVTDTNAETATATTTAEVAAAPTEEHFPFTGQIRRGEETRHGFTVGEATKIYIKLTWNGWADLSLRAYDPDDNLVGTADASSWRNKVEEITITDPIEAGDWEVGVHADTGWGVTNYSVEVIVYY